MQTVKIISYMIKGGILKLGIVMFTHHTLYNIKIQLDIRTVYNGLLCINLSLENQTSKYICLFEDLH